MRRSGPAPESVVVVDDRPFDGSGPPPLSLGPAPWPTCVVRTGGRGPAAARNAGWRSTTSDVDRLPGRRRAGRSRLARCAAGRHRFRRTICGGGAGNAARSAADRSSTRPIGNGTLPGLQDAAWITADMVYRRTALAGCARIRRTLPAGLPRGRRPGAAGADGRLAIDPSGRWTDTSGPPGRRPGERADAGRRRG